MSLPPDAFPAPPCCRSKAAIERKIRDLRISIERARARTARAEMARRAQEDIVVQLSAELEAARGGCNNTGGGGELTGGLHVEV